MHGRTAFVATGSDTFALPNNMGMKFGQGTDFVSMMLEIHYNNPEGATEARDSSGFTALVTTTPRELECASQTSPDCQDALWIHF